MIEFYWHSICRLEKNNAAFEHGRVTINRFSEIQASIRMHIVHYKSFSFFNKLHFIIICLIGFFFVKIGFKKEGGIASLASFALIHVRVWQRTLKKWSILNKKNSNCVNFYQVNPLWKKFTKCVMNVHQYFLVSTLLTHFEKIRKITSSGILNF